MALKSPSLKELALTITSQVSTINNFLEKNALPQPSFAVDGPASLPEDLEVQSARLALIEAATDMLHLAMGPLDYMRWQPLTLKYDQLIFEALNHYNVFDAVPLTGSISYTDLAAKTSVSESRLRRIINHAILNRIFWAPTPDTVAHTSSSSMVVKDPLLYAWLGHNAEEAGAAATKVVQAIDKWGDSEHPGQTGFNLTFGLSEDYTCFSFFENDGTAVNGDAKNEDLEVGKIDKSDRTKGWRSRRFGNAMKAIMGGGSHASHHALQGFDWDGLGKATVVDCGGSIGHVSVKIASQHPDLTMIVQDFGTLNPQFDATVPTSLKPRISFQAHDFFTPQPVKGAEVYFFKHILHDWPDSHCVKIIQNIVPAMNKGGRIIIMDGVMPELGQAPYQIMKLSTSFDLQMMCCLNAKERRKEDWEKLFIKADVRLVIKAIKQPPGSAASVIEVVFEG
jgi:hypothetical protein